MEVPKIPIEMEFLNRIQFAMVEEHAGFEPTLTPPKDAKCIGDVDVYLKRMFQVIQKIHRLAGELMLKCNTHSEMEENEDAKREAFVPFRKASARIQILSQAFVISVGDRYPKIWKETSGILLVTKGWKIYWLKLEIEQIPEEGANQVIVLSPESFEVEA